MAQGTADLMAALTGGNSVENAAYMQQAQRILNVQNAQMRLDDKVREAHEAVQEQKRTDMGRKGISALLTSIDPKTGMSSNELAGLVNYALMMGMENNAGGFVDDLGQLTRRIGMGQAADEANITPINRIAFQENLDAVPTLDQVGKLMVRGNYTAEPVIDALATGMNTTQEGKLAGDQRERKIRDVMAQNNPATGQRFNRAEAVNIVDRHMTMDINDATGNVVLSNLIDGTAIEVPLSGGTSGVPPMAPEEGRTLFELAGAATGVANSIQDLYARGVTLFGADADLSATSAIQTINTSMQSMIRALTVNPKFPVAEQDRILEEIKIRPGMFTSVAVMQSRMESIAQDLMLRAEQAERDAADQSMPQATRAAQRQNAADIRNFLPILGVPGYGKVERPTITEEQRASLRTEYETLPGWQTLTPEEQDEFIERSWRERSQQ
jgi:hypothetical protein